MNKLKQIIFIFLIFSSNAALADVMDNFTKAFVVTKICSNKGTEWMAGLNDCANACMNRSDCKSFIFYPTIPGTAQKTNCSVKTDNELCKVYSEQANFYHKLSNQQDFDTGAGQNQKFIYSPNVDCNGDDIQGQTNLGNLDLKACASLCIQRSDCIGISYGPNTCSLKSSVNSGFCNIKINSSETTYYKFGAPVDKPPTSPVATCAPGDQNCMQQIRYQGFDNQQPQMYMYPRITRAKTEVDKKEGDATKIVGDASTAVLLQTSYLARVMVQANDVFPPSHVSSRTSGETYLSSYMPYKYNVKTLIEASIKRNMLGSEYYSGAPQLNTLVRDWVEQHLNKYCDPLAAKAGIYNCVSPNSPASKDASAKSDGTTNWEEKSFAADINASTLMQSKIYSEKGSDAAEAALRYIYNITNNQPAPFDAAQTDFTIPGKYLDLKKTPKILKDEGYNAYMSYLERQAKLSLSQYALMRIFAEHMPLESVKIPVVKWTDKGKQVTYESTSRQGLLEFEANKRFSDPNWYDRVQQMPTPALLKELAYMQALQLTLQYKQYEQQQIQIAQNAVLTSEISAMMNLTKDAIQSGQKKAEDIMKGDISNFQGSVE